MIPSYGGPKKVITCMLVHSTLSISLLRIPFANVNRLRDMGLSVELYEYCHHRKNAMISMTQALSLIDFSRAVSSLDMLLQTVSMSIMTALKAVLQVIQRPVQHTSSEHELLCRRVLGIGRRLSGCGGHFDAARNSHFNQILNTIRNELVKLYTSQHDSAEANCLRMMPGRRSQYLEGLTENTLPSLSTNLLKSMDSAVGDILEPARKGLDLDPGRPSRISATHLALLSNRLYGNIDARDVGFDMSCDMIGRNALHIAVERADVDYVRAWLEETKNNPSLLSNTKDKRDIFGLTPLMISAYQGCVDVFRLLLEAGAELKPQTRSGRSLLSLAAMAGNESIVAEILSRGVKIQDHINFCSPIHDAAASGRSESIILLLLEHNAEPRYEHPAYPGQCASKVAREKGHRKIARILQDAETRLNATKPVSDDIVKHLQERLDHMANSSSPDSPSTTISTSRLSPGIETNRRVKRQRSIHYEYNSSPMSSSSSTPRVQPTNPAGPSPLFQVTNRPSFADASGNLNDPASSPFHYFLDPSSDYSILDLESSFGNT